MKTYTRKQAEKILIDRDKIWFDCHDLCRINRIAKETNDNELYHATMDLNGYVLGY